MQQLEQPLYGITISTNYSDILNIVLPQNQKFFTKWYIVTAEKDQQTVDVIQSANYPNIEILYFDFQKGGVPFNKGGALQMAQKQVLKNHNEGVNVLIVDSDIFIPDNFATYYTANSHLIESNKMYGSENRFDYSTYSDFKNKINGKYYKYSKGFVGYFQLYKQTSNKLYKDSENCAKCDLHFTNLFVIRNVAYLLLIAQYGIYDEIAPKFFENNNCIYIPITVSHLGCEGVNWDGRKSTLDFIMDDDTKSA
jgi:hypothetical protein